LDLCIRQEQSWTNADSRCPDLHYRTISGPFWLQRGWMCLDSEVLSMCNQITSVSNFGIATSGLRLDRVHFWPDFFENQDLFCLLKWRIGCAEMVMPILSANLRLPRIIRISSFNFYGNINAQCHSDLTWSNNIFNCDFSRGVTKFVFLALFYLVFWGLRWSPQLSNFVYGMVSRQHWLFIPKSSYFEAF